MIINIKDIREDQVKKLTIDIGKDKFLDIDPEVTLSSRLKGEIKLFLEDKICLQGKIIYNLSLPCFRCNEYFENQFMVDIIEYFEESDSSNSAVKEVELDRKSIITFPVINGEIDIENVIRDYIITSIPIYPVCPTCVENENKGGDINGSSK